MTDGVERTSVDLADRRQPPASSIAAGIPPGILTLVLAICLSGSALLSQQHLYQLDFRKDFLSWGWTGNLQSRVKTGQSGLLQFNNRFVSNLYRQAASNDIWRDENDFHLSWEAPVSSRLRTRTSIDSRILNDGNAAREFNQHIASQALDIRIFPNVTVTPRLGYTVEEAFSKQDYAWYAGGAVKITNLNVGTYVNNSDLRSNVRAFPNRRNESHTFLSSWKKEFSEYASDSLHIGFQFSDSRYFISPGQPGDDPVQEAVFLNDRFVSNQLTYRISSRSNLAIQTNFHNRDVDQGVPGESSRQRQELSLDNQFQYLLASGPFLLETSIFFSQAENNNATFTGDTRVTANNINILQTALNNALRYAPSSNDALWARFSFTKFEYNTPENNPSSEDRDELRFIIDGGYRHRFSSHFSLALKSNVYLYHQIYIRAGRSQNNNWNRIYQLGAEFDHTISAAVTHRNRIRILSNFTVFDFDELLPRVRSFIFRKLVYTDSLSVRISSNLSVKTIYQWEQEDNGVFFKSDFSQQINKELSAHFVSLRLQHRDILGLVVSPGVSMLIRDEWSLIPQRLKVREFTSITPRISIAYPASERLLLYATYAPTRISNATRSATAMPDSPFADNEQNFVTARLNLQYRF